MQPCDFSPSLGRVSGLPVLGHCTAGFVLPPPQPTPDLQKEIGCPQLSDLSVQAGRTISHHQMMVRLGKAVLFGVPCLYSLCMLVGNQAGFRQEFAPFRSGVCIPRVFQVLSIKCQ